MKIQKWTLDHKYFSTKAGNIKAESIVPFNFYIKRHNNFLIFFEAGTYITNVLHSQIIRNIRIYIDKHDRIKFDEYSDSFRNYPTPSKNDIFAKALQLDATLSAIETYEQRLETLYQTISNLMGIIFSCSDEHLPIDILEVCATNIAKFIFESKTILHPFIALTPDVYSTHHHSTNVAFFSTILANKTGLSFENLIKIAFSGLLHDIGKIRIDKKILDKNTILNEEEFEKIKTHSNASYEILLLNGIKDDFILNGVLGHHEKLDGSGYPKKIKGKMVPTFAQIIGICDTFDAMTVQRTYRFSYSSYEALLLMFKEMQNQYNKHYLLTLIHIFTQEDSSNILTFTSLKNK